jgi:hypothetical protein
MDTNPQHDAGNRLPPGVPNGRADSEILKCRYAGSGSEFASIYNPGNGGGFSGEHPGPPVFMRTAACCTRDGKAPVAGTMSATGFISR